MEGPDHWAFPYMDQEIGQDIMSALQETGAMLFGAQDVSGNGSRLAGTFGGDG
jgi:hypothetical protein